ncbi:MAG: hypothetical protein AABY13_04735 [Nanoarchaeota archaeon]
MHLQDLYNDDFMREAAARLQPGGSSPRQCTTRIDAPEVVSEQLACNWVAFNYTWALGFRKDGSLILGEIGGIMPSVGDSKVLAIATASVDRVEFGIQQLGTYDNDPKDDTLRTLETKIERPLEQRSGATIINGNINVAHYDFITKAACTPHNMLVTNGYLLWQAMGAHVLSQKALPNEMYVLTTPHNMVLASALHGMGPDQWERKHDIIKKNKGIVLDGITVIGMHITYDSISVTVRPVITEQVADNNAMVLKDKGMVPMRSHVQHLGQSDAYGNFGVFTHIL